MYLLFSIACYNASGVSITKYASAAQRSTLDSMRTLFIWIGSLILGWESFIWLELIGFIFLVSGTLIFNEIVIVPWEWFSKNTKVMAGIDDEDYNDDAVGHKDGGRLTDIRLSSMHQKAV